MLEEVRKQRAAYLSELVDIQAVSICDAKFYKRLKSGYRESIFGRTPEQSAIKGDAARDAIMGLFR
jgi:hypothetical protein